MPKPFPPGIIFEIIEISVFKCLVKAMKLSVSFLILNRVTVAMEIAAGSIKKMDTKNNEQGEKDTQSSSQASDDELNMDCYILLLLL